MFRTRERVGEGQRGKAINQKVSSCLGCKNFVFQFGFGDSEPQEVEHVTEAHLPAAVCSLETITMFLFTIT